jgi:hypothetical protein
MPLPLALACSLLLVEGLGMGVVAVVRLFSGTSHGVSAGLLFGAGAGFFLAGAAGVLRGPTHLAWLTAVLGLVVLAGVNVVDSSMHSGRLRWGYAVLPLLSAAWLFLPSVRAFVRHVESRNAPAEDPATPS